jgi:hypothetical protein
VAFVELQVKVAAWPLLTTDSDALNDTVAGGSPVGVPELPSEGLTEGSTDEPQAANTRVATKPMKDAEARMITRFFFVVFLYRTGNPVTAHSEKYAIPRPFPLDMT